MLRDRTAFDFEFRSKIKQVCKIERERVISTSHYGNFKPRSFENTLNVLDELVFW
jgi:hypothetical protein